MHTFWVHMLGAYMCGAFVFAVVQRYRKLASRVPRLPQTGGMLPYQDTCILHADTYTLEIRIGSPDERRFAFARIVPSSQVEW